MYETKPSIKPKNGIGFYFGKLKELELGVAHFRYLSPETVKVYADEVRPMYEILYDRIITSKVSPFIKQEFEHWFMEHRPIIGVSETSNLNHELESMLRRYDLI